MVAGAPASPRCARSWTTWPSGARPPRAPVRRRPHRDDLYDLENLQRIAQSNPWLTVVPVVESEPGLQGYEHGSLADVVTRYGSWSDREVLVCGSPAMIRATVSRCSSPAPPGPHPLRPVHPGLTQKTHRAHSPHLLFCHMRSACAFKRHMRTACDIEVGQLRHWWLRALLLLGFQTTICCWRIGTRSRR